MQDEHTDAGFGGRLALEVTDPDPRFARAVRPSADRFSRITNSVRILELMRDATKGAEARLMVGRDAQPIPVRLGAKTAAGRGYSGAMAIVATPLDDAIDDLKLEKGQEVAVWLPHPTGIFGFKTPVAGRCQDGDLVLDLPRHLIRYGRRGAQRVDTAGPNGPLALVPLTDTSWHQAPVLDLSLTGLALLLPEELDCPVGMEMQVVLILADRVRFELRAILRNCSDSGNGYQRLGVEFVHPPRAAELAIQRYASRLSEAPGVTSSALV